MNNKPIFFGMPLYELGRLRIEGKELTHGEQVQTLAKWLNNQPCDFDTPLGMQTFQAAAKVFHQGKFSVMPTAQIISLARAELARQFLRSGMSKALFIDSDVSIPVETIEALDDADGDVVFCAYPGRQAPHTLLLQTVGGVDPRQSKIRRSANGHRVIEAMFGGFGAVMVSRSALERMWKNYRRELSFDHGGRENVDLFQQMRVPVDEAGQIRSSFAQWSVKTKRAYVGEDVAFFLRARKAGVRVECLVDAPINHAGIVWNLAQQFDRTPSKTQEEASQNATV